VALNQGDSERAETLYRESANLLRELGEKSFLAYSLRRFGILALHQGHYARATALCKESLTLNVELEEQPGIVMCLAALAAIIAAQGKPMRAAQLFGAVESLVDTLAAPLPMIDRVEYDRNLAAVRAQLDEAIYTAACAAGRALTIE
jgi:hypothetical protein